jgi:hypothetical protein
MLKESLKEIYRRDLNKLKSEIESYSGESGLWIISGDIKNSAGNLSLHLNGNLKHFIGAVLGKTGYIRDRDREFSLKNIPKKDLLKSTDETIEIVIKTIDSLSEKSFVENYPVPFLDKTVSTVYLLIHFSVYLNYHLGQINYHRRLTNK